MLGDFFAPVESETVVAVAECIFYTGAAIVEWVVSLECIVSARCAYSEPQMVHPPVEQPPAVVFAISTHENAVTQLMVWVHTIVGLIVRQKAPAWFSHDGTIVSRDIVYGSFCARIVEHASICIIGRSHVCEPRVWMHVVVNSCHEFRHWCDDEVRLF